MDRIVRQMCKPALAHPPDRHRADCGVVSSIKLTGGPLVAACALNEQLVRRRRIECHDVGDIIYRRGELKSRDLAWSLWKEASSRLSIKAAQLGTTQIMQGFSAA